MFGWLVNIRRRIHFRVENADDTNQPVVDAIEDEVLTDATAAQAGCHVIPD